MSTGPDHLVMVPLAIAEWVGFRAAASPSNARISANS
jgi:hypothetical protein